MSGKLILSNNKAYVFPDAKAKYKCLSKISTDANNGKIILEK